MKDATKKDRHSANNDSKEDEGFIYESRKIIKLKSRDALCTPDGSMTKMLKMSIDLEAVRQRDYRYDALRNFDYKRIKKRYDWSYSQEQLIVAFAIKALRDGLDLTKIEAYKPLLFLPNFQHVTDPRVFRYRLYKMCHENHREVLGDYCGLNLARDDQQKRAVLNTVQTIRAGCLALPLVRKWKLESFTRASAHVPKRFRVGEIESFQGGFENKNEQHFSKRLRHNFEISDEEIRVKKRH